MTNGFAADVLICGAGAAGLTLGIELARRGISFQLIEKMSEPFRGSRGKGIQPRTQEIFEDLGILDRVVAAGGVYPPMRVYGDDGSYIEKDTGERPDPTPAEPYAIALMIPQFLTERIMRERLAELGHRVEYGCELVGFEQGENGVMARLAGPNGEQTVRARYLVGADGGRSFVRGALGLNFPGKTLGVRAVVADVLLTGLDRDAWHQFNDGDMERMVAICPLAGTDLFQIQAPIPLDGEVDLSAEQLGRLISERTGRADVQVDSVAWASAYLMNARLADRYRVDRVFLVGDAAHIHPPTGGQGLNTSVQDAYNLGWKLAAVLGGADDCLLDTYEQERRPVAESVLGLSTRLLDAQKQGGMHRGREVRQLDIGYPDSSLSRELAERSSGPRAGDRAPDAQIRGAAGQPWRLFQLLKGPHWTLLVHRAGRETVAPRQGLHVHYIGPQGDVIDAWGHLRDAYALAPGDCVLIRPDGYVGAIAILGADRTAELEIYLARMGLVQPEEEPK
ncbi:FAD-dependent oxidoreductase [Mesorhizobium sp. B292B1B]|uniref:FAD-dependent oxidoreductase n=1 Tax=unclassified Mesorhizobium TaxID=325217 RepID=UPI00112C27E0|nr:MULTISPECIES: FAD-dependent oxidoreductase [unclassified Mesorhizobium]MCA0013084.1 FAD-dependent oxidoreductase [Mesorhizobium sp. B294B1A1]MCA0040258.1 FAD-dependent oxidoreductase [Mesorhizobium sp. B292B1B]TPM45160.1 FAD-binding protein [Mesorhizobium sp. B2-3-2]